MKLMAILFLVLGGQSLLAKEIKIYDQRSLYLPVIAKFNANHQYKRAWVELSFTNYDSSSEIQVWDDEVFLKKVPNLIYEDGKIIYIDGKKKVVCAEEKIQYTWQFFKKVEYDRHYEKVKKYDISLTKSQMKALTKAERKKLKSKMKLTNCDFKVVEVKKLYDDGFDTQKYLDYTQVFLVIND